jgi:hypothetical protein
MGPFGLISGLPSALVVFVIPARRRILDVTKKFLVKIVSNKASRKTVFLPSNANQLVTLATTLRPLAAWRALVFAVFV